MKIFKKSQIFGIAFAIFLSRLEKKASILHQSVDSEQNHENRLFP
jgi:hypothetical protein